MFQCGLEMNYWTGINHLFVWGSIVCYFAVTLILYTSWFEYSYEGVAVNIMATGNFWFSILVCVVILLVPIVTERFYYSDTRPTLTDKVGESFVRFDLLLSTFYLIIVPALAPLCFFFIHSRHWL